ncbi:MAG: FAD-binding oxidoreductase, partial [Rhodospirillales bacterium]
AGAGELVLLEREDHPGYHATGRSAALFTETYGNAVVRALTRASRRFLESPPAGFAETPLLTPRGLLYVGGADQQDTLTRKHRDLSGSSRGVRRLSPTEVRALCPILRDDHAAGGLLEPDCSDIDVAALHHGFLAGVRRHGGRIVTDAEVRSLRRDPQHGWVAETNRGPFAAPVMVNAAGAWADAIAGLGGIRPAGLTPLRRSVVTVDLPDGVDPDGWPMVVDADETFYFKPDAGRLLVSPGDETPSPPCDAQAEEIDIAIAVDRLETATTLQVRRIGHSWAGLRTFAVDRTMIVGFDPAAKGFFWLAGQGGYGVQTAPFLGRIAAAMIAGKDPKADLAAAGLAADRLAVQRLR